MADPTSIFSVVAGAAGLALQCGKVVRDLHDLRDRYKNADLTIASMESGLETINWAWTRIQNTLETWSNRTQSPDADLDVDTLNQLSRSLEGGRLVLSALDADIQYVVKSPPSADTYLFAEARRKTKIVWNERMLRDHQERIRDQVNSMNLLINVLRMVLQKSDESAFSIVPSRPSTSFDDSGSLRSSVTSLVYNELDIDADLFTARVYKRNYRNATIRNLFRKTSVHPVSIAEASNRLSDDRTAPMGNPTILKESPNQIHSSTRDLALDLSRIPTILDPFDYNAVKEYTNYLKLNQKDQ
ncbi:MAG: hypothetical protein Q9209_007318 [Squamulea sp. 1 TL-2023]